MIQDPVAMDGETIKWREGLIRIWGISAPDPGLPQGRNSRKALAALCAQRTIMVIPMGRDGHGRIIGRLEYGRGDIGRQMVAGGHAACSQAGYLRDEAKARKQKLGLWRETSRANSAPPDFMSGGLGRSST